jgi:hypothetical protein
MSIEMPYFNYYCMFASPFLRSVPYVKNTLTFIITKRRCSIFFSPSGDGAFGSAFWWNLNGISLPISRYPVIVRIIDGGDLTNVARQNI